jgi:hypothetical protein
MGQLLLFSSNLLIIFEQLVLSWSGVLLFPLLFDDLVDVGQLPFEGDFFA